MTDTPNHDDAVSLDSVLDGLLADAARESGTTLEAAERADGPAIQAASTDDQTSEPEPMEPEEPGPFVSRKLEEEIEALATEPSKEWIPGDSGPGNSVPEDSVDEPLGESLEASLDGLLKQAQELHDTVSEVAPERVEEIALPPSAIEPEEPEPAAVTEREAAEQAAVQASGSENSIQSLDAELAALTDDLLAGEIEAPQTEARSAARADHAAAVSTPALAVNGAPQAPLTNEASHAAVAATVNVSAPALTKPSGPSLAARLLPVLKRGAGVVSEPARIALGLMSLPILGKRSLQQSIGWLAAYTVFLATALWIYLMAFHSPQGPVSTSVPSSLHGDGHGGHGDEHDAGQGEDGHGSSGGGGHGGGKSESSGHEASKSDGHGAKSDAHGAAGHENRVVNGYAVSKNAPAKAGAKAPAKDGHGAKKEAKSGGH